MCVAGHAMLRTSACGGEVVKRVCGEQRGLMALVRDRNDRRSRTPVSG